MKYIDAEKLKAEIRKLCSESCISESDDYYEFAKTEIIDIINSLQQEQPDVDLEEEIRKHTDLFQADIEYPLRLTAIKFYELGRKGGSK